MLPAQNILYLRISSWSWELWEKQHDVTSDHTINREWGDEMCTEERNYIKWMKDESCQHFPGRMERLRKRERKRGGEGEWWLSWLVENWIRLIRHNLASHQTWQPGRGEPLEHNSTLICLFFTSVCRLVSLLSCHDLKPPTTAVSLFFLIEVNLVVQLCVWCSRLDSVCLIDLVTWILCMYEPCWHLFSSK